MKRGIAGVAVALLLVVCAWLGSNWNDAPPQPLPAALQLPQPSLPDARNAYFAFIGLRAAPERDPSIAGQAMWKHRLDSARVEGRGVQGDRYVPAHDTPPDDAAAQERILGKALPSIDGAPLVCKSPMDDCVAGWIDAADALRTQRDQHALLGERCERLILERDFAFDEVLAPMRSTAEPIALHASAASTCSKWLTSGAVLAWVQKDHARAGVLLTQADRLNRALLDGSHSLIGQMIAVRMTRDTLATASALAVRDAAFAAALKPLLAPLPDPVRGIKRWMVVEAAFQRGSVAEVARGVGGHEQGDTGELGAWLASLRVGWHPRRTMQLSDARWLRSIAQLDDGLDAAIRAQAKDAADSADDGVWRSLTWVNPIGNLLVEIARPAFVGYVARQADLVLHHEVTTLAIGAAMADVPPAQRRTWAVNQPLTPAARERVTWSDDGMVLSARTWQETSTPDQRVPPKDAIRIAWPGAR